MRGLKVNKSAFVSHACMDVGGGARASSDMGRQWTSSRCKIESLFLLLLFTTTTKHYFKSNSDDDVRLFKWCSGKE